MSRIAITVEDVSRLADVIALIRRITELSIADIRERVQTGKPIVQYDLFYNDHDEKAQQLRDLMHGLPSLNARLRIYELDDEETFDNCRDVSTCEISPAELTSLLDEHDRAIERRFEIHENE